MSLQPTNQPDQSQLILLKQKVFDLTHELQLIKLQNQNLLTQITQLKQKQKHLKQLNDMLMQNLKTSQQQINDQITLNINGEFLTKRIHELEEELEKYRTGVSDSVDRRVKKIVNQFTQEKQLQFEKRKSRLSLGNGNKPQQTKQQYYQTHEHKYYNIEYKNFTELKLRTESKDNSVSTISHRQKSNKTSSEQESLCLQYDLNVISKPNEILSKNVICEKCFGLEEMIDQKEEIIHKLNQKLRSLIAQSQLKEQPETSPSSRLNQQTEEWKLKYLQVLKLYENLKQQHDLCQNNFNESPKQNPIETYTITQSPINGFKKKQLFAVNPTTPFNSNPCESRLYNEHKDREQQMLQEITNLVNGLGRNKKSSQKENYLIDYQQSQYQKQQHAYMNDKKSRVSYAGGNSRLSQQPKLDGSQFTIKEGVNRYGSNNGLF